MHTSMEEIFVSGVFKGVEYYLIPLDDEESISQENTDIINLCFS